MSIPVVTLIGKSGSGKTTLMEGLIPELSRRGYRIATIKHHSHSGFEVDREGKDSWRHSRAGSVHVIIAAPDKIASYRNLKQELTLAEIVKEVQEADLILVEGYRQAELPFARSHALRGQPGVDRHPCPALCCGCGLFRGRRSTQLTNWVILSGISDLIEQRFLRPKVNCD